MLFHMQIIVSKQPFQAVKMQLSHDVICHLLLEVLHVFEFRLVGIHALLLPPTNTYFVKFSWPLCTLLVLKLTAINNPAMALMISLKLVTIMVFDPPIIENSLLSIDVF